MADPLSAPAPTSVVVVGAGIVGLSVAWFLRERGVEVTVVDRHGVAAGASAGNAGWISPGILMPLNAPGVVRVGLRSLVDRRSAVQVPLRPDPRLWSFLAGFARRCTATQWSGAMAQFAPLAARAIPAFDELGMSDLAAAPVDADVVVGFRSAAQSEHFADELEQVRAAGGAVAPAPVLHGADARDAHVLFGDAVHRAQRIPGQQFIDPARFTRALGERFTAGGGTLLAAAEVTSIARDGGGVRVEVAGSEALRADAAVIATGALLPDLARPLGVRVPLAAGRGYSFSVPIEPGRADGAAGSPIYLPEQRLACTPLGGRLRIAGTMEFRRHGAPPRPSGVRNMRAAAQQMLRGLDWPGMDEVWVGSRPVTADSVPVIGATSAPGVFVAGGHGMWGVTLGPVTGKLLAESMVTGRVDPLLRPFDPQRRRAG